jgi:hypothetical protein
VAKKHRPKKQKDARNKLFVRAMREKKLERMHQKWLRKKALQYEERQAARLRTDLVPGAASTPAPQAPDQAPPAPAAALARAR